MTLDDVLMELLSALGATGEAHLVGWPTVQQWPGNTLNTLLKNGVLTLAKQAESIECPGCDNHCFMDVLTVAASGGKPARACVVCDDPEMQGQMGKINIPLAQLQQWRMTALQMANVVAGLLGIESKAEHKHGQNNIRVGMVKGKKGRKWLSLNLSPLTLEINEHQIPLEEVLLFEGDTLTIDQQRINLFIDTTPCSSGKKYKPSVEKREAGKRKTEAMYEDWQEEYLKLRRKHPDTVKYSDTWISIQIAKLDIAKDRDAETIRKNMKK